jgi:hypothetical protein
VLAGIPQPPPCWSPLRAWVPNAALAQQRPAPLGGVVVEIGENDDLPFANDSFDWRHPSSDNGAVG